MRILGTLRASTVLRFGIAIFLTTVFFAGAMVGIVQGSFSAAGIVEADAQEGFLDLRADGLESRLVYLNGEWDYYPRVFAAGDRFDERLLRGIAVKQADMPLENVVQSIGPATYRLKIQTNNSITGYAFYLENYNEDFAIYVNGDRVEPVWEGAQSKPMYQLSDYLFRIELPVEPGISEIILSANSGRDQSLLYRNALLFGPADDLTDYVARVWRDDTFLIGMILVMVTMGLVFILIRTKFDMLTSIALFDTLLAIRILLGYSVATYFVHHALPVLRMDNVDFVGLQYVSFFLTGAFGCLLSQSIFDAKRKLPSWPIRTQITVCAVGGVFTLFFFRYAPIICIWILFFTLVGSFLIVTWHVWNLMREKRLNRYFLFQICKTYYVGVVMALDILNLWKGSYNTLVYAYVIFMFAHLAARLIDSNASYMEVEKLNRNLEAMIQARTKELTETNRCLSEQSVRDPLTQAHNRLYFEGEMEQMFRKGDLGQAYLCMFDLDFFKTINDRFGHAVGDEQLKFVVNEFTRILGDRGTLSRIGGEEFAILFQGESKGGVLALLEQMRRRLDEDAQLNEKRTTASFGLVRCRPGDTSKDIMRAADRCLYSAKKMGRNCIVVQ